MIKYTISRKKLLDSKADCYVLFVEQDFTFTKELTDIAKKYIPNLKAFIKQKAFTGSANSSLLINACANCFDTDVAHLLFVGMGGASEGKKLDIENLRRALGNVVRVAEKNKFKTIACKLPEAKLFGVTQEYLAKQVGTILTMASYHFDQFITQDACKFPHDFKIELVLSDKATDSVKKNIKKGLSEGECIAQAVNKARLWIDLPPADLTPIELADAAKKIAKKHDLKIKVLGEKEVEKLGMGGLAAVSRGSERDCALVLMEYTTKKKNAPTLAFVGKGITFDSGGLSLKPSAYMETMKEDMSGAAAVIAAMDALGHLKPDVNIICVAPLAENLPSGKATMPGDIIKFYNGKTAEVKNTDAEGRLVLADALSYVEKKYKPDAIIDLATLTGACQYALGPFFCGMMSKYPKFIAQVEQAAKLSGDRVWNLPFCDDYKPAIKSTVADISNTGNKKYMAGTITAGFFLKNFVEKTPWVHLDIAGTAFNVPDISYFRPGATGFGVRLLVELALNWK